MNARHFQQLRLIYRTCATMDIKTFAFLDLETTGLPHLEFGATKITELSVTAVHADHIRMGVLPRVQNKLTLCFNPRKAISAVAADITGLTNDLLEFQEEFNVDTVNLLASFLNLQVGPICFVSHNGNRFDFPIIRTELTRVDCDLPADIMCVDSLPMFRALHQEDMDQPMEAKSTIPPELMDGYDEFLCSLMDDIEANEAQRKIRVEKSQIENEKTPKRNGNGCGSINETLIHIRNDDSTDSTNDLYFNPPARSINKAGNAQKATRTRKTLFSNVNFKLTSVYERLTDKVAIDAHKAECDTGLLLECAAVYGNRFLTYCNNNATNFQDIPVLKIGKKTGS